ncbi:radical SAM protein [Thermosulfurimonas sp. F29]|uniref:radical SAM protein n=1 Tax=Thermosulfurimonas sp. F29 TaxID=2867247 RepID=UPI001C835077|nr:radical SAM protein [Thermosulfurimonas sp. F29]MBX6423873.1 radical SAM protein [Thermosulfurimonas sp. F29]
MGVCRVCGKEARTISSRIGFCVRCIREYWPEIEPEIRELHARTRRAFGLPEAPPRAEEGLPCNLCFHRCRIPEGAFGYCGVWQNREGRLVGAGPNEAHVSWYLDPLPTNCVADFVCAGGTGAGHPRFAHRPGPEYGYFNLAVFYEACNFNCLYCQNWHFRRRSLRDRGRSPERMLADLRPEVSCICYFGGDPGPQAPHALALSRRALERTPGRILRICWETNGAENPRILRRMMELSLETGGTLKVDLKAFSPPVHRALCGVSNTATLENFRAMAELVSARADPPPLVASTLLVPGYVDEEELEALARFLAELNPEIPWALLAFHPDFYLNDLPTTSRRHAEAALALARSAGLKRVSLGNVHLLDPFSY